MDNELKIAIFLPLNPGLQEDKLQYLSGIFKGLRRLNVSTTVYYSSTYQGKTDTLSFADTRIYYDLKEENLQPVFAMAAGADIIIKIDGSGFSDSLLDSAILGLKTDKNHVGCWKTGAERPSEVHMKNLPHFDFLIYTSFSLYNKLKSQGAASCWLPNATDISVFYPSKSEPQEKYDLVFEANFEQVSVGTLNAYFLSYVNTFPYKRFCLVGRNFPFHRIHLPLNCMYLEEVPAANKKRFYNSAKAICFWNSDSNEFSYMQDVLNAVACGTAVLSNSKEIAGCFFQHDKEINFIEHPEDIGYFLKSYTEENILEQSAEALKRVLTNHTFNHRSNQFNLFLTSLNDRRKSPVLLH